MSRTGCTTPHQRRALGARSACLWSHFRTAVWLPEMISARWFSERPRGRFEPVRRSTPVVTVTEMDGVVLVGNSPGVAAAVWPGRTPCQFGVRSISAGPTTVFMWIVQQLQLLDRGRLTGTRRYPMASSCAPTRWSTARGPSRSLGTRD